jgi:hypothetical protein
VFLSSEHPIECEEHNMKSLLLVILAVSLAVLLIKGFSAVASAFAIVAAICLVLVAFRSGLSNLFKSG